MFSLGCTCGCLFSDARLPSRAPGTRSPSTWTSPSRHGANGPRTDPPIPRSPRWHASLAYSLTAPAPHKAREAPQGNADYTLGLAGPLSYTTRQMALARGYSRGRSAQAAVPAKQRIARSYLVVAGSAPQAFGVAGQGSRVSMVRANGRVPSEGPMLPLVGLVRSERRVSHLRDRKSARADAGPLDREMEVAGINGHPRGLDSSVPRASPLDILRLPAVCG